jgi:hypothetical protein
LAPTSHPDFKNIESGVSQRQAASHAIACQPVFACSHSAGLAPAKSKKSDETIHPHAPIPQDQKQALSIPSFCFGLHGDRPSNRAPL